jgi:hypothetical protein
MNVEAIDRFFAALIAGLETVMPGVGCSTVTGCAISGNLFRVAIRRYSLVKRDS